MSSSSGSEGVCPREDPEGHVTIQTTSLGGNPTVVELSFVKAGAVDMAKHGLKRDEDLLSSWVFAFLIHHINNPPVQTAETISEMPQRHYSLKVDGSLLPSRAFSCPRHSLETP